MTVKNKTNKNYKRSQKGRSMVEMLGVLAIVGTLSVGGVYGYGVAMKKHKANELLHQASMLATTISAKALTNDGVLPETITDFGNSGYATTLSDNGTKFILTMKDVDSAVCNQLKIGGMVQGVNCKEGTSEGKMNAEITYYKNLATTEAEGEKRPTGGSTGTADSLCQDVKCETGQQCIGGACAEVGACTENCQNCVYDHEREEEICEKTIGCSQNNDCDDWCETNGGGEKCYCSINANFLEDDSACYNNFTGVCAVATTKSGIKGGYVASRDGITWWSAVNFCKAHNKSLVSLADFGITDCDCENLCTWTVDPDDLRDKLGDVGEYWTTDGQVSYFNGGPECVTTTNNNVCMAFTVHLEYGVGTLVRLYTDLALCK